MSLLSKRVITLPAHASPTDAKRSHPSAPLAWVTFWVTQKPHRAKTLIAEGFTVEVRVLSRAPRASSSSRYGIHGQLFAGESRACRTPWIATVAEKTWLGPARRHGPP